MENGKKCQGCKKDCANCPKCQMTFKDKAKAEYIAYVKETYEDHEIDHQLSLYSDDKVRTEWEEFIFLLESIKDQE